MGLWAPASYRRALRSSARASRVASAQHEAVLAMINSLDTGDICVPCPLVEEEDAEELSAVQR